MTIGEKLKRARKKLDYDLDDVAKSTKIAKMFLIAIENDELSNLPGGVYTRNFIRAYAKHLQLDEDIITAEYHDQYEVKPHFVEQLEQTKSDDMVFRQQRRYNVLVVTIISLIALAALVAFFYPQLKGVPWLSGKNGVSGQKEPALVTGPATPPQTVDEDETSGQTSESEVNNPPPEEIPEQNLEPAETVAVPGAEMKPSEDVAEQSAVASSEPGQLPLDDLLSGQVVNGQPQDVAEVFAIEALEEVRVQVTIDGTIITHRLLMPGQVRVYAYGNYNSLLIENGSKAAIQTDTHFYRPLNDKGEALFLEHFGPQRLTQVLAQEGVVGLEIKSMPQRN